jgi:hypothetical protein
VKAQGWRRDPFGVHGDRWFSEGQPTSLVRDRGAESYDKPPPGEPPGPPVPAGTPPPAGPGRFPRDWRYWTVIPPCLLAVLVAALATVTGFLGAAFSSINSEGVAGYVPPNGGWILAAAAGAVIAMLAALRLARSSWPRRIRALTAWGIVPLQVGWVVLAFYLVAH